MMVNLINKIAWESREMNFQSQLLKRGVRKLQWMRISQTKKLTFNNQPLNQAHKLNSRINSSRKSKNIWKPLNFKKNKIRIRKINLENKVHSRQNLIKQMMIRRSNLRLNLIKKKYLKKMMLEKKVSKDRRHLVSKNLNLTLRAIHKSHLVWATKNKIQLLHQKVRLT
jgi:hypothetical protein